MIAAAMRGKTPPDGAALGADQHLVSLRGVGMTYTSETSSTEAIRNVTGGIVEGRFVSLIGPSGCGKSTLLEIVGGLLSPTRGSVAVEEEEVRKPRRDTAMVFQEDSTLHWRTVSENIAFGLEVAGVDKTTRAARVQEMIQLVGLSGFEGHRPGQLSGGMKQRVALALDPRILLMDEPFGALDQQTRMFIGLELLEIWEKTRKTVLFVTHDIREAVHLSDEVWLLSRRPTVVKEVVNIDLPRPRGDKTMRLPEFHAYVERLWEHIKAESAALGAETTR
jgi:NitT/TauT family transport system ATP-binding protein